MSCILRLCIPITDHYSHFTLFVYIFFTFYFSSVLNSTPLAVKVAGAVKTTLDEVGVIVEASVW